MHALDEAVPAAMCPSGVPGIPCTAVPGGATTPYPVVQSSSSQGASAAAPPEPIPPDSANFSPNPDRWDIAMPEGRRYHTQTDAPYVQRHCDDPLNRTPFKEVHP